MTVLNLAGLVAAVLAGTGGCLAGVRAADWVNHRLGRNVPTPDPRMDIAGPVRPVEPRNRSGSVEDTREARAGAQRTEQDGRREQ